MLSRPLLFSFPIFLSWGADICPVPTKENTVVLNVTFDYQAPELLKDHPNVKSVKGLKVLGSNTDKFYYDSFAEKAGLRLENITNETFPDKAAFLSAVVKKLGGASFAFFNFSGHGFQYPIFDDKKGFEWGILAPIPGPNFIKCLQQLNAYGTMVSSWRVEFLNDLIRNNPEQLKLAREINQTCKDYFVTQSELNQAFDKTNVVATLDTCFSEGYTTLSPPGRFVAFSAKSNQFAEDFRPDIDRVVERLDLEYRKQLEVDPLGAALLGEVQGLAAILKDPKLFPDKLDMDFVSQLGNTVGEKNHKYFVALEKAVKKRAQSFDYKGFKERLAKFNALELKVQSMIDAEIMKEEYHQGSLVYFLENRDLALLDESKDDMISVEEYFSGFPENLGETQQPGIFNNDCEKGLLKMKLFSAKTSFRRPASPGPAGPAGHSRSAAPLPSTPIPPPATP